MNHVTREMKEFAEGLLRDPNYRREVRRRLIAGDAPALEAKLWDKLLPSELALVLAAPENEDLTALSYDDLANRALALAELCRAASPKQPAGLLPPTSPETIAAAERAEAERVAAVKAASAITPDSLAAENSNSSNELREAANTKPIDSGAADEEAALRDALIQMLAEQAEGAAEEERTSDKVIEFPARSSQLHRNDQDR